MDRGSVFSDYPFISVNSKLFPRGFLSLIASLQATGSSCFVSLFATYYFCCYILMIAMLLSCLLLYQHSKFISERYSPMFLISYSKFKLFMYTGRFTESYFVTVPPFDIISDPDHLAPNCCCAELFSRLIATVRIVYPRC